MREAARTLPKTLLQRNDELPRFRAVFAGSMKQMRRIRGFWAGATIRESSSRPAHA
jgi:hypothetical protein